MLFCDRDAAVLTDGDSVRDGALVRHVVPQRRGKFFALPDVLFEKGPREFCVRALLSVFSEGFSTVLVDLLHEEKEPTEWSRLHAGAERGVNCEHMQAMAANILQRHWEWHEDRRTDLQPVLYRYNTALQNLDVKTAFDVTNVSGV